MRAKWREAKRVQRTAAAAAHAEAEERKRIDQELAAKATALAVKAERERKSREPIAGSGNEIELQIVRIAANPRMVICAYRAVSGERRSIVRVGRNGHFVRGMKLRLREPSDPSAHSEPWTYTGPLPRRRGRW